MKEYWNQYIKDKKYPSERGTYLVLLEKYNGIRRRECDMWLVTSDGYRDWMMWGDRNITKNDWRVIGWGELPDKNVNFEEEYPWPKEYKDFVEKELNGNEE